MGFGPRTYLTGIALGELLRMEATFALSRGEPLMKDCSALSAQAIEIADRTIALMGVQIEHDWEKKA